MSRRHPDERPDRDASPSYSLDELSREADVTPRTIRYYIAEGLLPPPESIGRNARYGQEHLDRLRLIDQLKAHYLPLKEIRTRLASMSPERISRAVSMRGVNAREAPPDRPASSAEDYLATVLHEPEASYSVRPGRPAPGAPMSRPVPVPDVSADRSWKRIPISAEAELLITEDAWDRRGDRIRTAITWIRRMLNE
jgi:DNA-binding transcriptional MerR regulator